MKLHQIEVSIDTFAALWSARRSYEFSEDDVIKRLLGMATDVPIVPMFPAIENVEAQSNRVKIALDRPTSVKWTDVLIWTLERLGGQAALDEIYRVSREGRRLWDKSITRHHDASARECLESHCSESEKYRFRANLFRMPDGKGAGVWGLR